MTLRTSVTAWAATGVTALAAFPASATPRDVVLGTGVRADLAAVIAILGAAAVIWVVWDTRRGALVRGRVLGHERRDGPDGPLDHPIIAYTDANGNPTRFTSAFGIGINQKTAPWPAGSTVTVRTDGSKPRHRSPLVSALFIIIGTLFLIAFVLVVG